MKFEKYTDALTLKNKLARLCWNVFYAFFFRLFGGPIFRYWRSLLLRLWGAKVGRRCAIAASAKIWAPWNLELGDYVAIASRAEVYNVANIKIGSNVTISQDSYLCTASHDISKLKKPLVFSPLSVEDSAWVTARAIILPGVTVGEGAVVAAGAVVTKDVEPWTVVGGNPAKVIKKRVIRG
jgi:putative colanic acid biosynthesis acetyltransferase WcaF